MTMKTIKLVFTVTALAIATIATAIGKPKLNVVPLTPETAMVSVSNQNAAYFEVSVETHNGNLVYYKQSEKPLNQYQKVFDFGNFKDGDYMLNLKIDDVKVSREFEINNSGIQIGNQKTYVDPYFSYDDGILKFSYLNLEKENMKLKIYQGKDLLFTSEEGNGVAISNGYNLNNLENGEYHVTLTSPLNEYYFDIQK